MKTKVYDAKGKSSGEIELPEEFFGQELNNDLVHQVVVSMMSNQRQVLAHTKGRSEVQGGGRKPWKQKGTGRARHGSSRSPLWVGGGVTFGPTKERNFKKKINKKVKQQALFQVLSQKNKDNELILVDSFSLKKPKTKEAKALLDALAKNKAFSDLVSKKKNSVFITDIKLNQNNIKSFANIANVDTGEFRKLNILDLLKYKYLIIINPEKSLKLLKDKIK